MAENSALFSEETIQFYREYVGVDKIQDLENHLTVIQQTLAEVCINWTESWNMAFTENITSKGVLIIAAFSDLSLPSREYVSDSFIKTWSG